MNNGIWKRAYVLVLVATLLVGISSISHARANIDHITNYKAETRFNKKMHLSTDNVGITTISMGGIFRGSRASTNRRAFRVDNVAPYTGRRGGRYKARAARKGKTHVRLSAIDLPSRLGIANTKIEWSITSSKNKTRKIRGKLANIHLKSGVYRVRLSIGSYKKEKTITIHKNRNRTQKISMSATLGLLNVSSSLNGAKNARRITWKAKNKQGKVIARGKGRTFRRLVPAGTYKVEAHYEGITQGTAVVVRKGAIGRGVIKLPTGSIKISAYNKGKSINEPIFSKTNWAIYNKKGLRVHSSKRHNLRLTLFPGRYTAVLNAKGKRVSKKFVVSSGRNADVHVTVRSN